MVGVILALIMIVSAFVMNDSINSLFRRQFDEIDQRDLVVTLDQEADADLRGTLESIDGVDSVERYGEAAVVLSVDGRVTAQQFQAFEPTTVAHRFPTDALEGRGIILGSLARDELGVEVDDTIAAWVPEFGTTTEVTVIGFVDEPITGFSYTNIDGWEAMTGTSPPTVVITLVDNDDHQQVRADVAAFDHVLAVHDQVAIAEHAGSLLAATRFFVAMMLAFAMAMAIALIFNAMTVTIGEREGEVATLQANGVGRRWIRRAITLENLVVVLGGVVPGLILGRVLGGAFLAQFSTPQFTFTPEIAPISLVISVVVIAIAAIAAQFPGLRGLDRLDLPSKVRERSV